MSASEEAKSMGFKSLIEVAKMFDCSTQCLQNWHKHYHNKFEVVLLGCKALKESKDED